MAKRLCSIIISAQADEKSQLSTKRLQEVFNYIIPHPYKVHDCFIHHRPVMRLSRFFTTDDKNGIDGPQHLRVTQGFQAIDDWLGRFDMVYS